MRFPTFFIGHGSPMNAIENNIFTKTWSSFVQMLPEQPKAIVIISAHWCTEGTHVTAQSSLPTLHDFYGFPDELSTYSYPAEGSHEVVHILEQMNIGIVSDVTWGLDHGAWSILTHMFPKSHIPMLQISIDINKSLKEHWQLGEKLSTLRDQGILFIGSGNVVHNLGRMVYEQNATPFAWATTCEQEIVMTIDQQDIEQLCTIDAWNEAWQNSIPTLEHYLPLLYILAMRFDDESIVYYLRDHIVHGSIAMLSLKVGE